MVLLGVLKNNITMTEKFVENLGIPTLTDYLSATPGEHLERLHKLTARREDEPRFIEMLIQLEQAKSEKHLSQVTTRATRSMMWSSWVLVVVTLVQIFMR